MPPRWIRRDWKLGLFVKIPTKGAVIGFTRALAREIGPKNITVNAIAFLAGPRSDFVTGQTLVVDGGWVMA